MTQPNVLPHVLLVEDNLALSASLVEVLELEDFKVTSVYRSLDGLRQLSKFIPDIIILDVMLPDMSGFEFLRRMRAGLKIEDAEWRLRVEKLPVIMLTARSTKQDILEGLKSGADHYLTKPIDPDVLVAHLHIQLNRTKRHQDEIIIVGRARLYPHEYALAFSDAHIEFSPQEFNLLKLLASHPDVTFSRKEILQMVWGIESDYETKTIDVHISKIKKKLTNANVPNPFVAIRGRGYRLRKAEWQ